MQSFDDEWLLPSDAVGAKRWITIDPAIGP